MKTLSLCAATANSKSRWLHGREAYFHGVHTGGGLHIILYGKYMYSDRFDHSREQRANAQTISDHFSEQLSFRCTGTDIWTKYLGHNCPVFCLLRTLGAEMLDKDLDGLQRSFILLCSNMTKRWRYARYYYYWARWNKHAPKVGPCYCIFSQKG